MEGSNEKDVLFPEVKNEIWHDWQASRQTCFLKKEEEIETTDPWNGMLNKERINEMNSMHGHFLSCTIMHSITIAYCIKHMSSSHLKQECRILHPIKALERPSGKKKIIRMDQSFQEISLDSFKIQKLAVRGKSRWVTR